MKYSFNMTIGKMDICRMISSPLVSIIIPIYNTERYINQCVNSILSQSYKNIEVILVNDGSTDRSPLICDQIVGMNQHVKVIHKENGGLSEARNSGLLLSKGQFVIYLDSDDFWISNDSLGCLVSLIIKGGYDFLCFNCSYFYEHSNKFKQWTPFKEDLLIKSEKDYAIKELVKSGTFPMSACLKIINRSFLIHNQIFFQRGIHSEDIPWFLELIYKAKKIGFTNQYIYAYRKERETSISSTFSEKKFSDLQQVFETELLRIQQASLSSEVKDALLSFMAYEYCILLGLSFFFPINLRKKKIQYLKQYRWILRFRLNPKVSYIYTFYKLFGLYLTSLLLNRYLYHCLNIKKI